LGWTLTGPGAAPLHFLIESAGFVVGDVEARPAQQAAQLVVEGAELGAAQAVLERVLVAFGGAAATAGLRFN
jgi:hypothetical protein